MEVETFIMAHNEEFLMPYLLRHYTSFSDVVILENNSTDKTVEIAESFPRTRVLRLKTDDVKDNQWIIDVKNSVYKSSKADYVIVVDADEFVYHKDIISVLKEAKKTGGEIVTTDWYEMCSTFLPSGQGQIYDEIKTGHSGGPKINIFSPKVDIRFEVGCHKCHPVIGCWVPFYFYSSIKTLHYRNISLDWVLKRNERDRVRLSNRNIERGWSYQYNYPDVKVIDDFNKELSISQVIL